MRGRIDDHDAWEDVNRSRRGWRRWWREEHAWDRRDEHHAGIRRYDDRIGFNEHGWGFRGSEVQLVWDHIAYDLAHWAGGMGFRPMWV